MQLGIGVKDRLIERTTGVLAPLLFEGETILALIKGGTKLRTEVMAVTTQRIMELDGWDKVISAVLLSDFDSGNFQAISGDGNAKTIMANGAVMKWRFNSLRGSNADRDMFISVLHGILQPHAREAISPGQAITAPHIPAVPAQNIWQGTTFVGGVPSKKALAAIARMAHSPEEQPWFVLHSFISGVIAAFDDRLLLIKTGAMTSFGAGSLGGERATTFYYPDITGIEYNAGLVNGVLEILTASYSGGGNKDFWRGATKSFNADSNNPFTLSNTLPLSKSEYKDALPQLNELRRKISESKRTSVTILQPAPEQAPANGGGLASQIRELKDLHDAGALSAEEFNAAKAKLLN